MHARGIKVLPTWERGRRLGGRIGEHQLMKLNIPGGANALSDQIKSYIAFYSWPVSNKNTSPTSRDKLALGG